MAASLTACTPRLSIPEPIVSSSAIEKPAYEPAFADYQPFQDVTQRNWQESNDTVRAHGGQAGAMEGGGSDAEAPSGGASPTSGHDGHH